MLGASRFSEVMHRIESILDRIRKEQLKPENDVINLLLEACDVVREQAARLKDQGECDNSRARCAVRAAHAASRPLRPRSTRHRAFRRRPRAASGFRIEVDLPSGQGITGLPLAKLYAELGALGRVEDLKTDGSHVAVADPADARPSGCGARQAAFAAGQ